MCPEESPGVGDAPGAGRVGERRAGVSGGTKSREDSGIAGERSAESRFECFARTISMYCSRRAKQLSDSVEFVLSR